MRVFAFFVILLCNKQRLLAGEKFKKILEKGIDIYGNALYYRINKRKGEKQDDEL